MDDNPRDTDSATATDAIRRKCYRGMAWGLALWVLSLCVAMLAPPPLPMPGDHPIARPAAWWVVLGLFRCVGILVLVFGGGRLALCTAPRRTTRSLVLRVLGAMFSVLVWAWGPALLVPAARRGGDRQALWLAATGGVLGFASFWLSRILLDKLMSTPWGWVLVAAWFLSSALLWRALPRLEGGGSRALRCTGWGLVLAVLLTAAALPGWRVPRLAPRADALVSSILTTAGYADANALFAAIPAPAAPEDDSLAALDPNPFETDATDWSEFRANLPVRHEDALQLTPSDLDAIDAWFAAHPAFVAAAEALSAPGYRSSLPAASSPRDLSPLGTPPRETRLHTDAPKAIQLLALRARAACARGDIPAALADIRRLDALATLLAGDPQSIGQLLARLAHHELVQRILPERLDLWDDASLAVLASLLEAPARDGFARYAGAIACETIGFEATLPIVYPSCSPDLFRHPMRTPTDCKTARWIVDERLAHAGKMRRALDTGSSIAAMPPGPGRADAYAAFRDGQGAKDGTMLQAILTPAYASLFRSLVLAPGTELLFLHAAAAVTAWHRDHGTLPPTLDGLLPFAPLCDHPFIDGLTIPPVYEPAPDGRSFLLRPPPPAEQDISIRYFLAPPSAEPPSP